MVGSINSDLLDIFQDLELEKYQHESFQVRPFYGSGTEMRNQKSYRPFLLLRVLEECGPPFAGLGSGRNLYTPVLGFEI